jgi:hypothetical protein
MVRTNETSSLILRGGVYFSVESYMDKESEKKLEYIDASGKAIKQLVKSLKLGAEVLTAMHPELLDQEKQWSMLKEFENIIAIGEKVVDKKTLH